MRPTLRSRGLPARTAAAWIAGAALLGPTAALGDPHTNPLERELGRAEVRVRSAAYRPLPGTGVVGAGLPERLERLGYRRVAGKPARAGEYFWGDEIFWIYRREFRAGGEERPALLFALPLRGGVITGALDQERRALPEKRLDDAVLEPEILAESLDGDRVPRIPIAFEDLPERVWRAVLAAEDHRFFDHSGLDARAIARALLANVFAGKITGGGSTITQQLVKNRDLTPKRTLGRKVSEAVRALALEESYDKREILETYLNHLYLGHVNGLAVHGVGAAAFGYFSKPATQLTLGEAALLAGIIQSPNRLNPLRHPEAARKRQLWVLQRLEELRWATADELRAARSKAVTTRPAPAVPAVAGHLLSWISEIVAAEASGRNEPGRGVVVETTIDPQLQRAAEAAVRGQLAALRRSERRLRGEALQAALVALDPTDGGVLAYVGGDPAIAAAFDRARGAKRQPGSAVKPLVLLEAFESCGAHDALFQSTRVADEPLTLTLSTGRWSPVNTDGRHRGTVDLRSALADSLNVPVVRVARHCGFTETAARFRAAGLPLPDEPPPSFVLGASEATPLELAGAFTPFAAGGEFRRPFAVTRLELPGGRRLASWEPKSRRVASAEAAFLVHDLLREAVATGTGKAAAIAGVPAAGKTGSTSELRDAWFVGDIGSVVAAVWVGMDDNRRLGLTGGAAAAPVWRAFMAAAGPARPPHEIRPPDDIVRLPVDERTGRVVGSARSGAKLYYFRHGDVPPRKWLLSRRALPVLE